MKKILKIKLSDWKIILVGIFMLSSLQIFTVENPYKDIFMKKVK